MTDYTGNDWISFVCPDCGHEIEKTFGRLKAEPHFPCPNCGRPFDGTEAAAGIAYAEQMVDSLYGRV